MSVTPRVSIGVPVLNGGATLARALDSLLGQTFKDFEVLVSDNASSDDTADIAGRYAAADRRVRVSRAPTTLPAFENFRRVLTVARAPYFMWLAADDHALPRLLEHAVAVLDTHPEVVCCVPRVEFVDSDGTRRPARGTFALVGRFDDNVRRFLHDPVDNSRFYGLFRREPLLAALPRVGYLACDLTVSVATLRAGLHWELDEVLLLRAWSEPDKYMRMIDTAFASRLARLVPLWPFTRALLFELRVPPTPATLYALARVNLGYHAMYVRYRYPWYGRTIHRVGRAVDRALDALVRAGRRWRQRPT